MSLPHWCRWGNGLEYDQNEPRQRLCDWLDKAGGCTLFDFVTKGIVSEAVRNTEYWRLRDGNGKQPGLMGWWPSLAVTFLDNHDTGAQTRPPLHTSRVVLCELGASRNGAGQGPSLLVKAFARQQKHHCQLPGMCRSCGAGVHTCSSRCGEGARASERPSASMVQTCFMDDPHCDHGAISIHHC